MKTRNRFLLASAVALAALGWGAMASAAPVITDITASGPGCDIPATCAGSFTSSIDENSRSLELTKLFSSLNPITLTFTVEHSTGSANPYDVAEAITNNSGGPFLDFHFAINEPANAPGEGVVFTSFNKSTLSGFTLDSPPSSGPRNLNFTGFLANGGTADAAFNLSPFDPGEGKSYTFTITQTPTIPEPGTWAMFIAGLLGVVGLARRRV